MIRGGAKGICFVISPGKSDIVEYYGGSVAEAGEAVPICYVVQPRASGLCDAVFRALPIVKPDEPVLVGLPDTVWFPSDGLARLSVNPKRTEYVSLLFDCAAFAVMGVLVSYRFVPTVVISTGILSQPELAGLKVPSMAGVFESIVGPWGAALINVGLVISVGGAFLSWTLLCAEIPYTCGKDGTFPRWFAAENAKDTKRQADTGIQTIKFDGADAQAYRAKAYQAGWDGIIKQSPEHGPKLKEFFSKK